MNMNLNLDGLRRNANTAYNELVEKLNENRDEDYGDLIHVPSSEIMVSIETLRNCLVSLSCMYTEDGSIKEIEGFELGTLMEEKEEVARYALSSLRDYKPLLKGCECKWCRRKEMSVHLSDQPIEHYDHEGGFLLSGFTSKQWLYVVCPKCEYQWSLTKLGIKELV